MRKLILVAVLVFLGGGVVGACGSEKDFSELGIDPSISENCSFKMEDFLNGENSKTAHSQWTCRYGRSTSIISIFSDGAGTSSASGPFTWSQTGCNSLIYRNGYIDSSISDINGSLDSGILTYVETNDTSTLNASCTLQRF